MQAQGPRPSFLYGTVLYHIRCMHDQFSSVEGSRREPRRHASTVGNGLAEGCTGDMIVGRGTILAPSTPTSGRPTLSLTVSVSLSSTYRYSTCVDSVSFYCAARFSSSPSCTNAMDGISNDTRILADLLPPAGPVELPILALVKSEHLHGTALGLRLDALCAPAPSDFEVRGIPRRALLIDGIAFEFVVQPRDEATSTPALIEALAPFLQCHLCVTGSVEGGGDEGSAREVAARAPLQYVVSRSPAGARVRVALPLQTGAPGVRGFRIDSVALAGCPIPPFPTVPLRVLVGACHDPSPAGDVWEAAYSGDVPMLLAALRSGRSTEEKLVGGRDERVRRIHVVCACCTRAHHSRSCAAGSALPQGSSERSCQFGSPRGSEDSARGRRSLGRRV